MPDKSNVALIATLHDPEARMAPFLPSATPLISQLYQFARVIATPGSAAATLSGLEQSDVHVYRDGSAYEVEFVTGEGETVAVTTLSREDVRPMGSSEILHARERAA